MSFPYDSLSAAYSGVTDSDPEPRKPYLIAYKYDRRKIRDKGRFRATGTRTMCAYKLGGIFPV